MNYGGKTPPKRDEIELRSDASVRDRMPPVPEPPAPPPAAPPPAPVTVVAAPPLPPVRVQQPAPSPLKPMKSMFSTADDKAAMGGDEPSAAGTAVGGQPAGVALGEIRPGDSDASNWLKSAGNGGKDFVTTPFSPPISKYMLQAGIIIQAITLNAVNSDLPGDVVAQITENVFDTPTGDHVLIPATAKLYGRYGDTLRYGQSRAQVAWNRILFPDGSSQNIGAMGGTDGSGAAGVEGEVDRHPWQMAGAVGVSAFITLLGQTGTLLKGDGGTTNIGSIGADGATKEASGIGKEFVTKELNRPNTLTLPQGTAVAIMITRDVALPPWDGHQWRADR